MKKSMQNIEFFLFWAFCAIFILLSFSMYLISLSFSEFSWIFSAKHCLIMKFAIFFYPINLIFSFLKGDLILWNKILTSIVNLIFYSFLSYKLYGYISKRDLKKRLFTYLILLILIVVIILLFGNWIC